MSTSTDTRDRTCASNGCHQTENIQILRTDQYGRLALCPTHQEDFPEAEPLRTPLPPTLSPWLGGEDGE